LTVLVLTKDLLGFSDLVINRGLGGAAVAWIAFYEVVPLAARTLPFAVLVGTLAGLGRLRADREILALEAAGVSSRRLAGPVLAFAAVLAVAGLLLTLGAAPWATRSLEASLRQMLRKNPGVSLHPGTVHEFGDLRMAAREVSARGDRLRGVLLWIPDLGQTIFAERGVLEPRDDGSTRLRLRQGKTLLSPRRGGGEMRFETFQTTLQAEPAPIRRIDKEQLAGVSLGRLTALARAGVDSGGLARRARTELHRRFSYPAASLVFGLLAVSLALVGSRLSRTEGGIVGLLVTVAYYGLVQLGDGLIQADMVSVGFGVWLPNLAVGVLAAVLLWQPGRRRLGNRNANYRERSRQTPPQSEARLPRLRRYLLQRYVARHYLQMFFLSFALLLVGYLLVDILERLEWFAHHHAVALKVLRFYGARVPLLASRVVPMALLLATALTVSLLSAQGELTGMRACGISAVRTLTSILLIAGVVAPGYFLLNEVVVPQTNALADWLKETEIKDRGPGTGLHMAIWYRAGRHVYQATQLDPQLGEAQEITIHELGADGLPVSRTDARAARHVGNGVWELVDPVRVEISDQGMREVPVDPLVQLGEGPSTTVDTMHLGVRQLAREIDDAEANGYNTTAYRVDLQVKLAAPLACLLLPAVALFFAIGGPPFPRPALVLLVSTVLGVGYILLTDVGASLGYGGFLPAGVAGWGPSTGLAILASVLALRSRG
jgi:lipopolysaccharide export system permease protein